MPTAFIALGANLPSPSGPPELTLAAATERLASLGRIVSRSSLYSTAPVGLADQPRFVNAVVAIETDLAPMALLGALLHIEQEFGRDRATGVPNGPRTLDLDVLMYGDLVLHQAVLKLPHPRLAERAFVLVPLNEIASKLEVPTLGKSVQQLLQGLRTGLSPESDAVYPLQSDVWFAGPSPSGDDRACPDARDADG